MGQIDTHSLLEIPPLASNLSDLDTTTFFLILITPLFPSLGHFLPGLSKGGGRVPQVSIYNTLYIYSNLPGHWLYGVKRTSKTTLLPSKGIKWNLTNWQP